MILDFIEYGFYNLNLKKILLILHERQMGKIYGFDLTHALIHLKAQISIMKFTALILFHETLIEIL